MAGRRLMHVPEDLLIYRRGDSLKKFFPIYWSKIEKYYESTAPCTPKLSDLSPLDLHRKWKSVSYKDTEFRSAIAHVSPAVVAVSFFKGVQRLVDCSGLVINWDGSSGHAIILTSAKLLRSTYKRDDYYIVVRLPNGKLHLTEKHYVDYYHNIVTFKVKSDVALKSVKLDSPSSESLEGIEVVALSRAFHTCKLSDSSGVIRRDYPYFGCEFLLSSTCSSDQDGEGGPLVTKTGQVCGINFFDGHKYVDPLPTSVIRSCLDKWSMYGIVMQPWFGLTVIDIAQLPPSWCIRNIVDNSTVVKEVYEGSPADKVGVRSGDLVTFMGGYPIYRSSEYAETLCTISDILSACHLNKTSDIMLARR